MCLLLIRKVHYGMCTTELCHVLKKKPVLVMYQIILDMYSKNRGLRGLEVNERF